MRQNVFTLSLTLLFDCHVVHQNVFIQIISIITFFNNNQVEHGRFTDKTRQAYL